MSHAPVRAALTSIALLTLLVVALGGVSLAAALRAGVAPSFRYIIPTGHGAALVIQHSASCPARAPLAACRSSPRREFRAWYYAHRQKHVIITRAWDS
jgi:hypothetical protein